MTRFTKESGKYNVQGKKYDELIGSRAQVWHATAYKTSGGLKKDDLIKNKTGHIVSKLKHNTAKKEKRLLKAGYGTKKGKFGFVKIGKTMKSNSSSKKGGRRHKRGGKMFALSPSEISGINETSGADLQLMATNY